MNRTAAVDRYIGVSAASAAALLVAAVLLGGFSVASERIPAAIVLSLAVLLARRFPLHIGPKTELTVDTAAVFAAALLFPPAVAAGIAAGSMLVSELLSRAELRQAAFNTAASALATLASATVFGLILGGEPWGANQTVLLAAIPAAATMLAVNLALIDAIVAIQLADNPLRNWWKNHANELPQEAGLYLFGLLAIPLADLHPYAIAAVPAVTAAVYLAMRGSAWVWPSLRAFASPNAVPDDAPAGDASWMDLRDAGVSRSGRAENRLLLDVLLIGAPLALLAASVFVETLAARETSAALVHISQLLLLAVLSTGVLLRRTLRGKSEASVLTTLTAMATTDELTGLLNRRAFAVAMDHELNRHSRSGRSCALLLWDLNHLKTVNDSQGHAAGDRMLRLFAGRLRNSIRGSDMAGRWGGDEFTILLTDGDPEGMGSLEARVNEIVTNVHAGDPAGASVGFALYPREAKTPDELLSLADKRMYAEKQSQKRAAGVPAPAVVVAR